MFWVISPYSPTTWGEIDNRPLEFRPGLSFDPRPETCITTMWSNFWELFGDLIRRACLKPWKIWKKNGESSSWELWVHRMLYFSWRPGPTKSNLLDLLSRLWDEERWWWKRRSVLVILFFVACNRSLPILWTMLDNYRCMYYIQHTAAMKVEFDRYIQ